MDNAAVLIWIYVLLENIKKGMGSTLAEKEIKKKIIHKDAM